MTKIDGRIALNEMERVLRAGVDREHCAQVLAALRRWRWDPMFDEATHQGARRLLREFDKPIGGLRCG